MSDKEKKDPKQRAFEKIKEQVSKEYTGKIDAQAKITMDAIRASETEIEKFNKLIDDADKEKAVVTDVLEKISK